MPRHGDTTIKGVHGRCKVKSVHGRCMVGARLGKAGCVGLGQGLRQGLQVVARCSATTCRQHHHHHHHQLQHDQ